MDHGTMGRVFSFSEGLHDVCQNIVVEARPGSLPVKLAVFQKARQWRHSTERDTIRSSKAVWRWDIKILIHTTATLLAEREILQLSFDKQEFLFFSFFLHPRIIIRWMQIAVTRVLLLASTCIKCHAGFRKWIQQEFAEFSKQSLRFVYRSLGFCTSRQTRKVYPANLHGKHPRRWETNVCRPLETKQWVMWTRNRWKVTRFDFSSSARDNNPAQFQVILL